MDLLDFHKWLQRQMKEKDIPKSAVLKSVDVPRLDVAKMELAYNKVDNTVTIVLKAED